MKLPTEQIDNTLRDVGIDVSNTHEEKNTLVFEDTRNP